MTEDNITSTNIQVKVAGTALAQEVAQYVQEVTVEQHSHLPHMFVIRLYDSDLTLIDTGPFDLAKEVEIIATDSAGTAYTWIKGEITALEPCFLEGHTAELIVRGYDKSHRLYRETKSEAFLNIKDSDLASQIAGNAGLSAQVDATSTVYDHIFQHNQTDMAFIMQRAWRIGYECFVSEGKLYFRKPPTTAASVTLNWGEQLVSFSPRMTLAEQVDEVNVRSWDADKQEAIVGKSTSGTLYPAIGDSKDGKSWASGFGTGKKIIVDQPVVSQAEANTLATARLNELSGAFIEAEGVAHQSPEIKAGEKIKLEGLGTRMSGSYLVTQVQHTYTTEGYHSHFSVRGSRTGLLAEQVSWHEPLTRWPGVVTGIVTNTDDPNDWGRVKVKFPWMTDEAESDWARVTGAGAGPEAGLFIVPDVNDEVVVAFEHGDFNRPFVLGGLWNGQNALPAEAAAAAAGEKPLVRTWHSRNGHWIAMHDDADQKIELMTIDGHSLILDDTNKIVEVATAGGHKVSIDDTGKKIEIKSSGGHTITLDDNGRKIIVKSSGDVEVKAGLNLKLEASANVDLSGSGPVNIKGAVINLN